MKATKDPTGYMCPKCERETEVTVVEGVPYHYCPHPHCFHNTNAIPHPVKIGDRK